MRSRPSLCFLFAALTVAAIGQLNAAVPNRITSAITDTANVARTGNIHPQVRSSVDTGRLAAATTLPGLSLNFAPSAAQQVALDALLVAQQNPASPSYHQWLTPTQFGEQFGMSGDDLAKVAAWLQGRGFTVERTAPSRNSIHFSGTVEQIEQAFHTELHTLTRNGENHFANTIEPSLPAAFAGTVAAIRGLNDFHPRAHARASSHQVPYPAAGRQAEAALASQFVPFTTNGASSPSEYVSPEDFAKIYDVTALYNAGFSGSASYPIAIIGQTAVRTADITDFRTAFGLSTNLPTMVLVPNTGPSGIRTDSTGAVSGDLGESELDLEWSGAVAPSAPIYFIYVGNSTNSNGNYNYDVFDALQYAIQGYPASGKLVPIISISYGECEPSDTPADFALFESWFQQANSQGQTILSASGDEGSAGCDYSTTAVDSYSAVSGLAVDYPSSSAYVTGVGGTSFSGDVSSASAYWATTNDSSLGNSLGIFIPSTAWNNTPTATSATTDQGLAASGGGVSALWSKPVWQTGVPGIPADGKRDVPDVALNADPYHDGYLTCINLHCEGLNLNNSTTPQYDVYGGTSVGAPSFAGILALAEQKVTTSKGNLNPSLYSIAANATIYATAFHDITTGSNIVPCLVNGTVVGTTNKTTITGDTGCMNGSMGYNATTGYDLATGLGVPDAFNLVNALAGVASLASTTSTLTYTPVAPGTGQTVTFTLTVAPTSGTTVPTGTVTFTVDGVATGNAASTLSGTGTATITASFTTGGSHTVAAVYSGDANYYGSAATATFNINAPANGGTTTTTLAATPTTLAVGSSLTLTANVASSATGTLTGNVTFKTGTGATLGSAPVTAASGGNTATATLAVNVAVPAFSIGANTVTATYNGNTAFAASPASSAVTVTVTSPVITLTATNISVASGGSGTSTITVTSSGGYAGTVALTASTTSKINGTYSFTPASVVLSSGGTGTSVFTLTGITGSAVSGTGLSGVKSSLSSLALGSGGITVAGFLLFGAAGLRRRRMASLLAALVFTGLAAGLGCGSSSSSSTPSPTTPTTGTYSITITGTDKATSSVTGSTTLTVTIH